LWPTLAGMFGERFADDSEGMFDLVTFLDELIPLLRDHQN
jgi:hypothetical protein